MEPFSIQIKNKIQNLKSAKNTVEKWKKEGHSIVLTNGCFDIIHYGHIDYLSKARDLGHKLIVGVNSDRSVKNLKGDSRPLQNETSRASVLASFVFCDLIVLFEEDTPQNLIKELLPNILVKGGDYKLNEIVGADVVTKNGGEVTTIPFVEGYSSTNVIKKMG